MIYNTRYFAGWANKTSWAIELLLSTYARAGSRGIAV